MRLPPVAGPVAPRAAAWLQQERPQDPRERRTVSAASLDLDPAQPRPKSRPSDLSGLDIRV